ncbi:nuclear transport factor 2 family protein [Streptomyces sp. NBC_00726]|uniref:nuclear transport factor 2 family protein n=1 Tax=Streptomyces sp. NBC_00726 TaxID=2903674 RepID=UPI00386CD911
MTAAKESADTLRVIKDKIDIAEVTSEFGLVIDTHDWDRLKTILAAKVVIDYSLLHGKDPVRTDPQGVVDMWAHVLEALKSTQHLIAGHLVTVDGDTAKCVTNLVAEHYLPNESGSPNWTLGGRYAFGLVRTDGTWLISEVVLIPTWSTGNRTIMQLAGSRNSTK